MAIPVEKRRYTVAEYMALEEKAEERHEFHDGEILAMAGTTESHSIIVTNTLVGLAQRLRGKQCRPYESNMRMRIPSRLSYVYPDVSIVCGGAQFDSLSPKTTTIVNPKVIIEVLSDSTEAYDRGGKFSLYREIESMEEYVLISQHSAVVETYRRQPEGAWLFSAARGLEAVLSLRSVQLELPLSEIYLDVKFEAPSEA